ncbi:hypothetical protein B5S27_g15 [[Candida] boidinii]|nr:hypothetical protein B5S27_g15 [[Candida] boidinii]
MVSYIKAPILKAASHYGSITTTGFAAYFPILAAWGAAAGFGAFVFTENWPLFQNTFYKKIPYFGQHWVKEIAPEDSPI